MEDREIMQLMAGGAVLRRLDDNGSFDLVTNHAEINSDQVERLNKGGWLKGFANGGGAWLSDAGRGAYIKSTDELGNGELVSPNVQIEGQPASGLSLSNAGLGSAKGEK